MTVIYSMFLKLKWTLCCHCPVFGGPWDLGVFENMADTLTSRNAETTKQNNEQNWFISQSEVGNPKYLVFHILFFFKPAPLRTSRLTWFSHHSSQGVKVLFFYLVIACESLLWKHCKTISRILCFILYTYFFKSRFNCISVQVSCLNTDHLQAVLVLLLQRYFLSLQEAEVKIEEKQ